MALRRVHGIDGSVSPGSGGFCAADRGSQGPAGLDLRAARAASPREWKRLQDVGGDADGDPFGGFPDRVARKERVARGGFDPAVTEEPADDRQALAERERPRGKGMTDVMDANVVEPGPRADGLPRPVDVGHRHCQVNRL